MNIKKFILAPVRFANWFKSHPMNRAMTMRVIATLLYLSINSLWLWPLVKLMVQDFSTVLEDTWFGLPYFLRFVLCMMPLFLTVTLPVAYPFWKVNRSTVKKKSFKKALARIVEYGAIRFLLLDLASMLFFELALAIMIVTFVTWCLVAGAIPFIIIGGAMLYVKCNEWLYQQTMKKGHWLFQTMAVFVSGATGLVLMKVYDANIYSVGLVVLVVTTTPIGSEVVRYCVRLLVNRETDNFTPETARRFRVWFDKASEVVEKRIDVLFDKARTLAAF